MIYTVTLNPALDRELTVPALTFDSVLRATAARVDWGGKGFNVSRVLAALGLPSVAVGFAGGRTGETLRDGLTALGIVTDFVPIAGETRTNVSVVTEDHTHHIKVNEAGPTVSSEEQIALRRLVADRARPGDWWVLAGSLPPGVTPAFYADLIHDLKAAGGRVILDTSDEALRQGCAAQPYLVKPNALEASQLTGLPVRSVDEALIAASTFTGIAYVVISMGKAGALLYHEGRAWFAAAPAIQERNPIGAGDSLVAGLLWGLVKDDPQAALRWGVACGAATASQSGTAIGTLEQVEQLARQVYIHEITAKTLQVQN